MTLDRYLLFVAGCIVLVLVPGPDMIFMLSRCVAQGRKAGWMAMLGFNAGGYCHLTAVILGLSAILAASPLAFRAIQWTGAGYLVYLGAQALRSRESMLVLDSAADARPLRRVFWQGFLSDVLNPKVAMFFLAFLPQFVDPAAPDRVSQLLLLGITVNMIALAINFVLVLVSASITEPLRRSASISRRLTQAMGVVFIALGLRVALG